MVLSGPSDAPDSDEENGGEGAQAGSGVAPRVAQQLTKTALLLVHGLR